eukprot:TRINITY_DN2330_c0_g1_i3.p1 TRINITY_DN2330_c0_g1~~TRINITY_DN2330_c0_g1_i3.p1  ORF type:complete len:485 (-),score=83.21 TRINITY_DN2330_c0_g1_i3:54-1508(-)
MNPLVDLMFKIVQTIDSWLRADERNVAVIHCMGGKGRTGTIIASYLFYTGAYDSIEDAENHFAGKRSANKRGVTQPSQRRYLYYFSAIVTKSVKLNMQQVRLSQVVIAHVDPAKQYNVEIWSSPNTDGKLLFVQDAPLATLLTFNIGLDIRGDIYIRVREKKKDDNYKNRFHIVLHSFFVSPKQIQFKKKDLDLLEFDKRFSDELFVGVTFTAPKSTETFPETESVIEHIRSRFENSKSQIDKEKRGGTWNAPKRNTQERRLRVHISSFRDETLEQSSTRRPTLSKSQSSANILPNTSQTNAWKRAVQQSLNAPSNKSVLLSSGKLQKHVSFHSESNFSNMTVSKSSHEDVSSFSERKTDSKRKATTLSPLVIEELTETKNEKDSDKDVESINTGRQRSTSHAFMDLAMAKIEKQKKRITQKPVTVKRARVIHNYKAQYPDELDLLKDETVIVLSRADDQWWYGYIERLKSKPAHFPRECVELL